MPTPEIYSMDYSQPQFYKFNEDSLLLRDFVLEQCKLENYESLIDVGTGCGVIGIELANIMNLNKLILFEKQTEFKQYIFQNIENILKTDSKVHVHLKPFQEYRGEKADLVVSNPPYFIEGDGRLPEDDRTRNCKFTNIEFFKKLDDFIRNNLNNGGRGFYLFRHDLIDLEGESVSLTDKLSVRMVQSLV